MSVNTNIETILKLVVNNKCTKLVIKEAEK